MSSLFGSLDAGKNALLAQQVGLDVVGQNIANATTEGYSRQRVDFESLPPTRFGQLFVGGGVGVKDIRRVFDQQIENRLQQSLSALGGLARQKDTYDQLERSMNALADDPAVGQYVSVGGQIEQFFNELQNLASDPSSPSFRSIFISRAESMSSTVSNLANDVLALRASLNESVDGAVKDINRITSEIAKLNEQIVSTEVGGAISGQANSLRDRRDLLLRNLAELTEFSAHENATGAVDVRVGGAYLVSGNDHFDLETHVVADRGVDITSIEFSLTGGEFAPREGSLGGLLVARDDILPGFLADLDAVARTIIQSFNEIHATGRGLSGLSSVTSDAFTATHALNAQLPISIQGSVQRGNDAGNFLVDPSLKGFPGGSPNSDHFVGAQVLFTSGANAGRTATIAAYDPSTGRLDLEPPLSGPIEGGDAFEITSFRYPIENGSFKLNLRNEATGITDVFDIEIDRDGLPAAPNLDDTTLQDLVEDINSQLNTFYGGNAPVRARITDDFRLEIRSLDAEVSFHFSDDTSGFLAAAGINTFFAGSDAASIRVRTEIADRPNLLATGMSAFAGDNANVMRMIDLSNEKLFHNGTSSISEYYRGVVGSLAVESATAGELTRNQELIAQAATNAREAISGVNVDEEAIDLIKYQRAFQAAARYMSVVDQLLNQLLNIL